MRKINAIDPNTDSTRAAAVCPQNFPNVLHTSFHCTCLFPSYPTIPTALVAPILEKSNDTIITSRKKTSKLDDDELLFPPRFASERTSETAAYALATALTTTKYLPKTTSYFFFQAVESKFRSYPGTFEAHPFKGETFEYKVSTASSIR